ncbi:HD domain-containing protein [Parathalassolituus penaei]|uniref:5'-deoxynucleotidase n=1 Tax=Parathalassolituus penaei TaxID=2997323 RepID=A0A9X3ITA1_9GAMM|nr:HD domain-containing protein [Parathalassolituus penaei]MCY0966666.1 HD domain-containing protein [Parathalassolituus penaei]
MTTDIHTITRHFLELDALKQVQRKSYIHGASRLENSAEHSWHLAMACWSIARSFDLKVDEGKLIKLALVHDLGEIDAGDTFLYSEHRSDAHKAERECIQRLAGHAGNGIRDLADIWEEQETGSSPETRLLKVVDRLLPFMLNVASEGRSWQEMGVKRHQIEKAHAFIEGEFPEVHAWISEQIRMAVAKGWLAEA